jgi:hypothetical protein
MISLHYRVTISEKKHACFFLKLIIIITIIIIIIDIASQEEHNLRKTKHDKYNKYKDSAIAVIIYGSRKQFTLFRS